MLLFFLYLEHQAVLSLLSGELGYSGADFYLLSILFPTDCTIATFYIKNESSEPPGVLSHRPERWLAAGHASRRELRWKETLLLQQGVDKMSTKKSGSCASPFFQSHGLGGIPPGQLIIK